MRMEEPGKRTLSATKSSGSRLGIVSVEAILTTVPRSRCHVTLFRSALWVGHMNCCQMQRSGVAFGCYLSTLIADDLNSVCLQIKHGIQATYGGKLSEVFMASVLRGNVK